MKQNKSQNIFNSTACISENVLLNYVNNTLTNTERNHVEQHTINCNFCTDAIEGFQSIQNSTDKYLGIKEHFNRKKSNLVYYISAIAASILIIFMVKNTSEIVNSDVAENKTKPDSTLTTNFSPTETVNHDSAEPKEARITNDVNRQDKEPATESKLKFEESEKNNYVGSKTKTFTDTFVIVSNANSACLDTDDNTKNLAPTEILTQKTESLDLSIKDEYTLNKTSTNLRSEKPEEISESKEIKATKTAAVFPEKEISTLNLNNEKSFYKQGKEAFDNQNWTTAIELLLKVDKNNLDRYYEANFLIGKSYLQLAKATLAKRHLKIASEPNSKWKSKSEIELNKL